MAQWLAQYGLGSMPTRCHMWVEYVAGSRRSSMNIQSAAIHPYLGEFPSLRFTYRLLQLFLQDVDVQSQLFS